MLFDREEGFPGLPIDGFRVFEIRDRVERRRAIVDTFHPALEQLGRDLIAKLGAGRDRELHAHLPRLDWPRDYQPFCTWLALSHEAQGYQARAQLNLGVHRDYVAIRLGWDTGQDAYGRFEFRGRPGGLGDRLERAAAGHGLAFRVYASARWPEGSREVFCSRTDWKRSLDEAAERGVWWEIGARHDLPGAAELVGSPELGREAARVFSALLPEYERLG